MNKPEELKILKKFKKGFHKIVKMGWIPSNRFHDTGIGKTYLIDVEPLCLGS